MTTGGAEDSSDRGRPLHAYGPEAGDAYASGFEDGQRLLPPPRLGQTLADLVGRRRWQRRLADARIHERWPDIAGEQVARHVTPVRLAGGVLVVRASSPAWATQLRFLSSDLVRRANEVLGEGSVTRVTVVGADPSRRPPGGGRKGS
jgi:predicted nucleic acid-binding Zn ribbon protein